MFPNRKISSKSIFYSLTGSFLDSFLIDNILIELVSCGVSIRFKTLLNRKVLPESILCSSTGSPLDLLLVDSTFAKLVSYDAPTRFKTLLNRKVSPKSIFYSLVESFFIFFKYF